MAAKKSAKKLVKKSKPKVKAFDFTSYRKPENAALRLAVSNAKEDVTEEAKLAGIDINGLAQLIALLGPLIAGLFKKNPPVVPPAPVPVEPAPTPVTPAPVPAAGHRIVGGKAKCTGLTEGGPLGKRWGGAQLAGVLAGTNNAPHDSRFEFDFTPTFEDGHVGTADDPYFLTTPLCPKGPGDSDGPMQQVRLRYDYEGPGSADLSREYANYGCTPRIRARTGGGEGGLLSNLRFEFDGGTVMVENVAEAIHVGRGA
jgi:hypothetical protein